MARFDRSLRSAVCPESGAKQKCRAYARSDAIEPNRNYGESNIVSETFGVAKHIWTRRAAAVDLVSSQFSFSETGGLPDSIGIQWCQRAVYSRKGVD